MKEVTQTQKRETLEALYTHSAPVRYLIYNR